MNGAMPDREPQPDRAEQSELRRIVTELGRLGFCLPGSITERRLTCGKHGCRCKAEPPVLHGPYHHWTRKIDGKTAGRYLSEDQLLRYKQWFANAKRFRELLGELEALSLVIAERIEQWSPMPPPKGHHPQGDEMTGSS